MSTTNNGGSKDGWVEIVAGVGKVEITGNVVRVTSFSGDLVPGEIEFDQIDDAIEQSRRDLAEMRRAMTEEARPLPKPPNGAPLWRAC